MVYRRVIQGIVTGIGFIGAGTILKLNEQREIQGLTTAAGLWMTAAIGIAVGLGVLGLAVIGTVVTLLVLALEHVIDSRITREKRTDLSCWWQLAATALCDSPRERECRPYKEAYHERRLLTLSLAFAIVLTTFGPAVHGKKPDQTPDKVKAEVKAA